jgi:hypothetical protein
MASQRRRRAVAILLITFSLLVVLLGGCAGKAAESTMSSSPITASVNSGESVSSASGTTGTRSPGSLYPACAYVNGEKRWGYIDGAGTFVVEPAYDLAADFQENGLAKIQLDTQSGLIDTQGNLVVKPAYDDISDFSEGIAIGYNWAEKTTCDLIGSDGQVIAHVDGSVSPFKNGQAQVNLSDGSAYMIDQKGQKIADVTDKNTETAATLLYDQKFPDGLAIVGKSVDYKDIYGLFDQNGKVILPQEFAGIERLGDNLFAAAKETSEVFWYRDLPKALFDRNGRQLSDYVYYDLSKAGDGLISAADLQYTSLLDETGQVYDKLPKIRGNGTFEIKNGLIKALIDQQLAYYSLDGKLIWQESASYTLAGGLQVTRQKYSPDRFLLIYYPEMAGLADAAVQNSINTTLKTTFINSGSPDSEMPHGTAYFTGDFSLEQIPNLLVVKKTGYLYPLGAAHGQPSQQYIHLDTRTGKIYQLKDLFKPGVDYKTRLEASISKQIKQQEANGSMVYDVKNPQLNEANFKIAADHLELFYDPYAIAPYAAGFPTFSIPFSEIEDLMVPLS